MKVFKVELPLEEDSGDLLLPTLRARRKKRNI